MSDRIDRALAIARAVVGDPDAECVQMALHPTRQTITLQAKTGGARWRVVIVDGVGTVVAKEGVRDAS